MTRGLNPYLLYVRWTLYHWAAKVVCGWSKTFILSLEISQIQTLLLECPWVEEVLWSRSFYSKGQGQNNLFWSWFLSPLPIIHRVPWVQGVHWPWTTFVDTGSRLLQISDELFSCQSIFSFIDSICLKYHHNSTHGWKVCSVFHQVKNNPLKLHVISFATFNNGAQWYLVHKASFTGIQTNGR